MKHSKFVFTALSIAFFALFSCNDPSIIGSELLAGDQLGIDFTDTLTLKVKTVYGDSVKTYSSLSSQFAPTNARLLSRYLFGEMNDPIFGKYRSELYFQFELNGGVPPDFSGVFDSAVLVLPIDTTRSYGKVNGTEFTAQVRATNNDWDNNIDYYSNEEVNLSADFYNFSTNFTISYDSLNILIPSGDSLIERRTAPQVRVHLGENIFRSKIFEADSTNFATDSTLWDLVEGMAFTPLTTTEGIVGLQAQNGGIEVYYHNDTSSFLYLFPVDFQSVKMTTFQHDYSGSIVETFEAGGVELGDSLTFLQGMAGVDIEIEIPYADARTDIVVNKAELIIPILTLSEDDPSTFTPIDQIIIGELLDDGTKLVVSDVQFLLDNGASSLDLERNFGGVVEEGDFYTLNITDHFQNMIDGSSTKTLRIIPLERGTRASRSVIAGPRHSETPMKLNLSYTILD